MSEWKRYVKIAVTEMRPYVVGEDMRGISISEKDIAAGSPREGDMIARGADPADQWLVSAETFLATYALVEGEIP